MLQKSRNIVRSYYAANNDMVTFALIQGAISCGNSGIVNIAQQRLQ